MSVALGGMVTSGDSIGAIFGNWLYFSLLVFSLAIPLLLSFDKKLRLYRQWKFIFPSLFLVAAFFILFDILMTKAGVWGFNPRYHLDLVFLGLPLEEWLFFIAIPYASIFLHEAIVFYFPDLRLSGKSSAAIVSLSVVVLFLLIPFIYDRAYTLYVVCLLILTLLLSLREKRQIIQHFFVTFLVILVPFLIVNGILTGSLIEEEVVWYNDNETIGMRIFTIPVEDVGYAFSMILLNLLLISALKIYFGKEKSLLKYVNN